ncbi:hypothetical protein LCGC14_2802960 [marine sediment metagenome]|uniref:DUF4013 domain-containing protein n=1 Tax=marine sediment metagenome TaxID=412755 RepID=A0A0F9BDJ4_9ZZZZ
MDDEPESQITPDRGATELSRPESFLGQVARAFAFPFRGRGLWLILGWAIFLLVVMIVSTFVSLLGLILQGLVLAIFCAYSFRIIGESAGGASDPPDWPDMNEFVGSLLRFLATVGACLGPALVINIYLTSHETPLAALFWVVLVMGMAFLPMCLLSVALHDSLAGLNPLIIVPAITRVLPAYLVILVVFYAAVALDWYLSQIVAGIVAILGPFIAGGMGLYFLMLEMHLLGVLYRTHSAQLGWFE